MVSDGLGWGWLWGGVRVVEWWWWGGWWWGGWGVVVMVGDVFGGW